MGNRHEPTHQRRGPGEQQATLWQALADLSSRMDADMRAEAEAERRQLREGEQGAVSLAQRMRACRGHRVRLRLTGGEAVALRIRDNSEFWILGETSRGETLIPMSAIATIWSLPARASEWEGSVVSRLSLQSALRAIMQRGQRVVLTSAEEIFRGRLIAVGADWLDLRGASGSTTPVNLTIPVARIARLDVPAQLRADDW